MLSIDVYVINNNVQWSKTIDGILLFQKNNNKNYKNQIIKIEWIDK